MAKLVYTVYIPIEGPVVVKEEKADFKSFQKYVGGYVERIVRMVSAQTVAITMFNLGDTSLLELGQLLPNPTQGVWLCNEEGQIKELGTNPRATLLMNLGYEIVGNVVLLLNWDLD